MSEELKPSIRPMEWQEPSSKNNYCHIAKTPLGDYYVHIDGGTHYAWIDQTEMRQDQEIGEAVGDVYSAQMKCKEHYENLVNSMLINTRTPDASGVVEALEAFISPFDIVTYKRLKESQFFNSQEIVEAMIKARTALKDYKEKMG